MLFWYLAFFRIFKQNVSALEQFNLRGATKRQTFSARAYSARDTKSTLVVMEAGLKQTFASVCDLRCFQFEIFLRLVVYERALRDVYTDGYFQAAGFFICVFWALVILNSQCLLGEFARCAFHLNIVSKAACVPLCPQCIQNHAFM